MLAYPDLLFLCLGRPPPDFEGPTCCGYNGYLSTTYCMPKDVMELRNTP